VCPAPLRPITECPVGTCADNRTVCCDTVTGESSLPYCDFGSQTLSCSGGLVTLRDIDCRVMPELVCPPSSEELGDTCPLPGAVCDYPLGCGTQQECRCQDLDPETPTGTNEWVCSYAICAK
jgi:hypothetical protein